MNAPSTDVTVRGSVLRLYGAMVTAQAPFPEVQLLLQQPENLGGGSISGSVTPQDSALSWRHRNGAASPARTPAAFSQQNSSTHSPQLPHTPREEEKSSLWLLKLCVSLVTQPREEQSDHEGAGGGAALEPSPIRLEALQVKVMETTCKRSKEAFLKTCFVFVFFFQVLSHLVRGYFSLAQSSLYEIGQVSVRCLEETDPSIQLHSAKVKLSTSAASITHGHQTTVSKRPLWFCCIFLATRRVWYRNNPTVQS